MAVNECVFGDGIQWIDLEDPTARELEKVNKQFDFPHYLLYDSMDPYHLPKYDDVEDFQFLITRYYHQNASHRAGSIQELTDKIAIFFSNEFVVTIHGRNNPFLKEIRKKFIDSNKMASSTELVLKLIWYSINSFLEPGQRLSELVDYYERTIILKEVDHRQIEALYEVKRKASLAQKVLVLLLDPLNHIRTKHKFGIALEDVKDHHVQLTTIYHQITEDANNLMNLYLSFAAHRTNEVMKVLTKFSVFFMPLSFLAGVYGMNLRIFPGENNPWGFLTVLLLMGIIALLLFLWFRKRKWL